MHIMLSKKLSPQEITGFTSQYSLQDLNLEHIIQTGIVDSLLHLGWQVEINNAEWLALSKKIDGIDDFKNPTAHYAITAKDNAFAAISRKTKYGINLFKNKYPFAVNDSVVTFFLRNNTGAKNVMLAGSFNNWSPTAQRMQLTDSGWIAYIKLSPGKYWYKFIIDNNWQTDKDNKLTENDGMGNDNSVYYKTNYVFHSSAFSKTRKLYVAGSFNNWNDQELALAKTTNGWQLPIYLQDGTHTYRFIADGNWTADPENNNKYPNEFHEYNSVLRIGKPYIFQLDGFAEAQKITLLGTFNNWMDNELLMQKTNSGWQLPYTLGAGNYEYTFKVNDKWVSGNNNTILVDDKNFANYFSLVIEPNYTFLLNGFNNAKAVYVAGDFNDWSPTTYPMQKTATGWQINIHLDKGKCRYKFVVDGKWILDPHNNLWEENEYGTGNSVLWIQ